MPLLLRTRARHLPRSARQLLHPASSHGAIARIPVLFRALQPARTRTALRRHPHNGIPISIGARFSSINPIPTCPGHVPHGRPPLLAGTARNRLLLIKGMMKPDTDSGDDVREVVVSVIEAISEGSAGSADDMLRSIDSVGLLELVVNLEHRLRVEIPDEVLSDRMFGSVRALCDVLKTLV